MHELALAEAIAETARRRAEGRRVQTVMVRVGYLRQVVPSSLEFSWEMVTAGSDLEGVSLEIEHVPAAVLCSACGAQSRLSQPIVCCPACGSSEVELLSGEEMLVATLDVAPA
ncbi:MAG: hydrogenase maturation nickel metallochaperone HypA [Acidimicrobiales bacterium]